MKDTGVEDLHTLQEELKRLGISVVSGRQDTVISVKIKGLAGRALLRGLRLADQLLQEKIKNALQTCTDPATKLFTDPTFGPSSSDPDGAAAICRAGGVISAKGGSQHQAKVLGLLQRGKIRWERPIYATENEESDSSPQDEEDDDIYSMTSTDHVFASNATLFADGVSSGDVIQGNLGDCWFLSALSVVATRSDLLEQTFWRRDQHKAKGLFVCKFMKNFVWNYVLIDDRLPVFGFTDKKAGKPYFARCRNPNELWVSLLEKAYAKLHGSYEALIGGFVDCALNDLTGMCSEQVILKEGFPGFGENPYIPAKPQQKHGDPFWEKLARYKQSGTLMGCSIQPPVTAKEVAVESSAGNGLYFKHAYALVDVAEIKTAKGESVRLVKLRNPWGMGEWTGPWSDSSEERAQNEDAIERFFKILKRKVGANAEKRVFMTINAQGKVGADEISQEEVTKINTNDGTFFMSYDAWMQSFTHFFAGIDFPDAWHGRRSEGSWNEANCGGNTTKSTWINNPHFELVIDQRARIFASLSQEDPRGSENLKIVPVGFHICSLSPIGNDPNKVEIREPSKKLDAYYRLYKPADRDSFQTGKRPEHLPPAIIPGTVIPSIDDDGVPQPAYTFKQAVSVEATMEPGRYCIIPSMYMRTDKATGNTNVGNFWLSVYSDKPSFRLEGGEKIVEEEEGDEENLSTGEGSRGNPSIVPAPLDRRVSTASSSKKSEKITATGNAFAAERRRKYENEKEELLRQAKRYGIGLRDLRAEFAKTPKIQKADCRHKLQKLGFSVASWDDEKIGLLFGEEDGLATGVVHTDKILKLFTPDIQEEKMACELPDMEEDGSLNPLEFEKMLERLRIEPALTQGQKTFLVDQFDANGDGEISMTEFKHWILQDRVWEEPPPVLSTARENKALIASEVFDTVIAPLCNEIIDRAFDAYMFSLTVGSWSRSTNSTTEAQTPQSPLAAETGDIVFQRVVSLNIAVGAPTNAVEKVFEQVDGDGSGNIDQFEFIELLSALGMHLNFDDATLLMNRLGAISMGGRITIERSAFLSYAEQMTTKSTDGRHCTSLRDIVIRVDALAGTEANAREIVQCELQQLHEKISHKELLTICKALDEKAAIAIAVDDLRSLAMNLSFDYAASSPTQQVGESADQLDNIKSSGDIVARMLLQEPSGLMKHLLEFDVASFCASSLLVRYEVVGRHTNVETSWQEFQDFIAGQQNVYAVMELHPQGSLFTTCVARASGSGAVKWNFKTQIKLEEPKLCDHRIDRPVVFTDTVKISRIPDSTPTTESINFIVTDGGESPGHFVVVSVRRALPSGPESPRLYCTAYDPLTSCDYAVEGYPQDWSVDFFDVTVSPSFEEKWRAMLQTMRLGETITPKLSVTVFNKKPKTDKLVGECEVSVGSAIILEGHIFEERIALHPPSSSTTSSTTTATTTAGVTALTFRFDVKKTPKDVDGSTAKEIRSCSHQVTGSPVPIKLGAQYLAGEIVTPRFQSVEDNSDDRLKQLQASIVSIEQSKLEAQEQVRQLKTQIQQLSYASNKSSDDTSERWKRRLEQARQEQFAAEEQHAARLAALQDEIRHLAEENEKQKNAPREASNLKDCRLSAASAHDILSAMRGILTSRCHARPYNGLKKALAAEAEIPGKVTFAVFNDVLGDFGLALSLDHRSTLSSILDPEMIGRINIEDFFIKLCGDAEAYEQVRTSRPQSPAPERSPSPAENPEPIVFTPYPPPVQRPVSPVASPIRASGTKSKMSWQDMKKFLVLNLPEGWETRFTEKGRPYFCNHDNRSTQWKHPRPEIETIFSEWVQENGAYFNRKSTSARVSKQKH
ncbi:hypothetical protein PF004_g440 [Phytophthora fragariae]|uniref:Uncharacterized protein n=1 Tax=Phytophthora fragariae TaxID=53985 RepID=A0A6G0PVD9_9STRA|nr:hypothetical protein PF004_g440 [Phytophthora fragariae]